MRHANIMYFTSSIVMKMSQKLYFDFILCRNFLASYLNLILVSVSNIYWLWQIYSVSLLENNKVLLDQQWVLLHWYLSLKITFLMLMLIHSDFMVILMIREFMQDLCHILCINKILCQVKQRKALTGIYWMMWEIKFMSFATFIIRIDHRKHICLINAGY